MLSGYKFRMYPKGAQHVELAQAFGNSRFVFNHYLARRKDVYEKTKKGSTYNKDAADLTQLKKNGDYEWLNLSVAQSLQYATKMVDVSYRNFFKKRTKFPRFKSRKSHQSCHFPQGAKLVGNVLTLPKHGNFKVVVHRKIPDGAKMKDVTVSKNRSGQYFVSILVEEPDAPLSPVQNKVGIDVGLTSFVTLSTGEKIVNPKIAWKVRKKLRFLSRQHSKKKRSKNRERARFKLTVIYRKTTNRKQDFSHKLSRRLVDENQVIAVEDLGVKDMLKNGRLARLISEVSWGEFLRQLEYKSRWAERSFVKVGRFFPSSKLCSCGKVNEKLRLEDRTWSCLCGKTHDRDLNAARNILNEGINLLRQKRDNSGEGLPSEDKRKLGEASNSDRKVSLVFCRKTKNAEVYEPRSPRIYTGE
jgi:putative transposase